MRLTPPTATTFYPQQSLVRLQGSRILQLQPQRVSAAPAAAHQVKLMDLFTLTALCTPAWLYCKLCAAGPGAAHARRGPAGAAAARPHAQHGAATFCGARRRGRGPGQVGSLRGWDVREWDVGVWVAQGRWVAAWMGCGCVGGPGQVGGCMDGMCMDGLHDSASQQGLLACLRAILVGREGKPAEGLHHVCLD